MAGDWIKVEKGGGQKPETLKVARMLGVNRREAYGLLVEFWEWLDTNCVDGVVDGVVDADVDALMTCPGLSALLKLVGWVRFTKKPPRMIVINFDRHNGETAKNRALKTGRQAKWRAKTVDAVASTREEKRRIKRSSKQNPHSTARANGGESPTPTVNTVAKKMTVNPNNQYKTSMSREEQLAYIREQEKAKT